jgi:hypothetical protein
MSAFSLGSKRTFRDGLHANVGQGGTENDPAQTLGPFHLCISDTETPRMSWFGSTPWAQSRAIIIACHIWNVRFCQPIRVLQRHIQEAQLHPACRRNSSLASSQSRTPSEPERTRSSVSRRASPCQAGDSIASSARAKSSQGAPVRVYALWPEWKKHGQPPGDNGQAWIARNQSARMVGVLRFR